MASNQRQIGMDGHIVCLSENIELGADEVNLREVTGKPALLHDVKCNSQAKKSDAVLQSIVNGEAVNFAYLGSFTIPKDGKTSPINAICHKCDHNLELSDMMVKDDRYLHRGTCAGEALLVAGFGTGGTDHLGLFKFIHRSHDGLAKPYCGLARWQAKTLVFETVDKLKKSGG